MALIDGLTEEVSVGETVDVYVALGLVVKVVDAVVVPVDDDDPLREEVALLEGEPDPEPVAVGSPDPLLEAVVEPEAVNDIVPVSDAVEVREDVPVDDVVEDAVLDPEGMPVMELV